MSKHSFHNVLIIKGGMKQAFVMDDFGTLRPIHWARINYFLSQSH